MKLNLTLLTVLFILCGELPLYAQENQGQEWPVYRGSSGYAGVSTDGSIRPPLKLLWSYRMDSDTSGDACSGIIIGGKKLYQSTFMERSVVALDAEKGTFLWEFRNSFISSKTILGYHQERVFLWAHRGSRSLLICLDANTGKSLWEKKFSPKKNTYTGRVGPIFYKDNLYFSEGGDQPQLHILKASTGKEVLKLAMKVEDGNYISAPCIAGDKLFMATKFKFKRGQPVKGAIIAFNPTTGKELWRNKTIYSDAHLVSDGEIVICKINRVVGMKKNAQQKMYVLEASTGKLSEQAHNFV